MMNTGGSAFPQVVSDYCDDTHEYRNVHSEGGMTLRDYFAAKAMQGMIASSTDDTTFVLPRLAGWCYEMADAMLKARGE